MTIPIPDPIRHISLDALKCDSRNVRVSVASSDAHDELVASIRARGLLENLVVTDAGDGSYGVVAGRRRLAALRQIHREDGGDPMEVACLVIDGKDAAEASLAENTVRVAMHPADQVQAFAKLAKCGASADDIAARFGVAPRTVQRRLRVGGLPAPILAAWRKGELQEDAVIALAQCANPKESRKVFDRLQRDGGVSAWRVRQLTGGGEGLPGDRPICLFVGVDAYRSAGGQISENLFADGPESILFLDADLVADLAQQELDRLAAEASEQGWKWTQASLRLDWQERNHYDAHRIAVEPAPVTDDGRRELATINERLTAISAAVEAGELAEADPTDAEGCATVAEEFYALERRVGAIHEGCTARAEYSDEDKAKSGTVFTIGEDGALEVLRGCLSAEDVQAEQRRATRRQAAGGARTPQPAAGPKPLSDALRGDLREIRGACVAQALMEHTRLAVDLVAFTLARKGRFGNMGHEGAHVLEIQLPHRSQMVSPKFRESELAEKVLNPNVPARVTRGAGWHEGPIPDALDKFLDLPEHTRDAVLAAAVADRLIPALSDDAGQHQHDHGLAQAFDVIVKHLEVDFPERARDIGAAPWSAEVWWSRLSKAQILDVCGKELGDDWGDEHRKLKKGALAEAAARAFAELTDWTPAGFVA